ncbi:MAG: hypothetical protein AAGU05_16725, partial [Anaerolineaceae bacterium]
VLKRAWHITWKHKILWIFGIFAGLAVQSGSGTSRAMDSGPNFQYNFDFNDFNNGNVPPFMRDFAFNMERFFNGVPVWFWIVLGVSLFILAIAFWVLSIYGRAGLVRGATEADEDKTFTFASLFKEGSRFFLRLLLLDLLLFIGGIILVAAIALVLVAIGIATLGIGLLCLVPLLCLVIPVGWALGVYLTQVEVALLSEDLGIWEAFARAWKIFTGRLGEMIVMGLILLVIGLVAGILLALPFGLVLAPFGISLVSSGELTNAAITAGVVIGLILLPFAILAGGILQTFHFSAWTVTFRRLAGQKHAQLAAIQPAAPAAPVPPAAPEAPEPPVDLPPAE